MLRNKLNKIIESIIISIIYSRLEEEISDTTNSNNKIHNLKLDFISGKQLNKNNDHISEASSLIEEIEKSYDKEFYSLYDNGRLKDVLESLSVNKDYENIKHNIAITILLDNRINYKNTNDYLEKISLILFNDKNKLNNMYKSLLNIYNYITDRRDTVNNNVLDEAKGVIPGLIPFLPKLKAPAMFVARSATKHPLILASVLACGVTTIGVKNYIYRQKSFKNFKSITKEDYEYKIIVTLFSLTIAKTYMNEDEYKRYFKSEMKIILKDEKYITKELFIRWHNVEENKEKALLISRFNEYVVKNIQYNN